MQTILTADEILAADDVAVEFVSVPEWAGGDADAGVYVRALDGRGRDAWERETITDEGEFVFDNVRARLCAKCIVAADRSTRLFSDHQVEALGRKSAQALDRVFEVAARLSRIRKQDVEDLRKNSSAGLAGDSA